MDIRYYRLPSSFDEAARNLIEEASEVMHIICKSQRFGPLEWHPDDPTRETNCSKLFSELQDLRRAVMDMENTMFGMGFRKKCYRAPDGGLHDRCCVETDCFLKDSCAIHRELT